MKTGLIIFGAFLVTLSIVLLIGDEIVNQITPAPSFWSSALLGLDF
jgi:hypothetical protein